MALSITEKGRENRLRRMATRQHRTLTRSRLRDPYAVNYGVYYLDDTRVGTLEDVEAVLTTRST